MIEVISHAWATFLNVVGHANPVWLFLAVMILPLLGCPASPLLVAVGLRLGTLNGLIFAMSAYLLNFTIGYWLARGVFHAPLGRFLERRGYRIPQLSAADETQFIVMIRITPGPPLFMQTYLLGLARVNFPRYLVLSMLIQAGYSFAIISFGQSLGNNNTWHIILAVSLVIAVGLAVNLLRRWMTARRGTVVVKPMP